MKKTILEEKSLHFAIEIIKFHKVIQQTYKHYEIASQIIRSGTSIGANIAEAKRSESKKDFIHKISIASKEAQETYFWLEALQSIIHTNQIKDLLKKCDELIALTVATLKTLKNRKVVTH